MNKVYDKIPDLVTEELEAANEIHSFFHSLHEGYAVLLEEVEEAHDELINVELGVRRLWRAVKEDEEVQACAGFALGVEILAERLAAEAIQVAAMARKMQASIERGDAS